MESEPEESELEEHELKDEPDEPVAREPRQEPASQSGEQQRLVPRESKNVS